MVQALLKPAEGRRAPARPQCVALVIPEPVSRIFSEDPFFPVVMNAISDEVQVGDHQLVLMLANSAVSRDHVRRFALAGHLDGAMLVSLHGADPLPATLRRMGVPVVAMERSLCPPPTPFVGVNSAAGAAAAAQHLLERGRRHLATICGPQEMPAGIDRLAGFGQVVRDCGLPLILAAADFTRESGARAMRELLDREPAIDGVFVASDLMALGALHALRAAGRRVPDDVALVGFDDSPLAQHVAPALTTVRQPVEQVGRLLARQLVRRLSGEAIEDSLVLDTQLVVRGSS